MDTDPEHDRQSMAVVHDWFHVFLKPREGGSWCKPTTQEQGDDEAIVGRRVFVEGYGKGLVVSFVRARIGASSHVIKFDGGGESKVKLARKGNRETPWHVWHNYNESELWTSDEPEPEIVDLSHADNFIAAANPTNSNVPLNEQRDDVLQTPTDPTFQLDKPQSKTVEETGRQVTSCGVFQSYRHSSWQAQAFTTIWLERQAEQGRSKLLVPELLSLEAQLHQHLDDEQADSVHNWLGGLLQLVTHLRWGIGTFWAPHYDTNPSLARSMFAADILVTSPLHRSAAESELGPHRLRIPPRIAISPTIHQLVEHSDAVNSVQFSPDGQNIVSASDDKTVRVWSAATGECVQTLAGHSFTVTSVSPRRGRPSSRTWPDRPGPGPASVGYFEPEHRL